MGGRQVQYASVSLLLQFSFPFPLVPLGGANALSCYSRPPDLLNRTCNATSARSHHGGPGQARGAEVSIPVRCIHSDPVRILELLQHAHAVC